MNSRITHPRRVSRIVSGTPTQDGAGVRLTRLMPGHGLPMLDPFLLLDVFHTDNPQDYIAGFPPHPHRGFETVTYLLAGRVRHRDSAGHEGVVNAGGIQWMTAGRGIEHSEMPEQEKGLLKGFQLWVNLPAARKMSEPRYQEFEPAEVPTESREDGVELKVITGTTLQGTRGVVEGIAADPIFIDVSLPAGSSFEERIPLGHSAFVYLISGEIRLTDMQRQPTRVTSGQLAVLQQGDSVRLGAQQQSRLLLIAGRPLGEPVARHGPFVMNSYEEIEQAYRDYENGLFGHVEEGQDAVA